MWGLDKAKEFTKKLMLGNFSDPADVILSDEEVSHNLKEEFEREIISEMQARYEERKSQRCSLDLQNRLNINFYNGEQYTAIDAVKNDIEEVLPLSTWEERNVFNEIAPCVETRFAFLSKKKNNLKNRPASASSEDRTAAKIGNKVLASTRSRLNMSELQQEANLISGIMGTAIWKTVWDPNAGRIVGIEEREIDEEEVEDLTKYEYENELLGYKKNITYRKIHEGDVVTTVHSPFEIYPENLALPLRKQNRIMHVILMSPEEVFANWGKIVKGEDHETYKIVKSDDRFYGSAITGRIAGSMFAHATVHNSVEVMEEWELPSARYPDGRLIICCDEALLYYGKLPDAMGEDGSYIMPFDVQHSIKTDGFFGSSVVERMIPLQIKYNSVKNRTQDYINRVTIGVLSVEENSLVDEDYYYENGIAPGEIIKHKRGSDAPRFLSVDSLPDDIAREEQAMLVAFNRLSGVFDLGKQSTVPSQVTSGVAIAGLAEQDDTRIGLEADNIKHCLVSVGKKWLVLYHNNVSFARQVADIGRNNEFEIEQFIGSDLRSFDVFVESEPESSDTLSQRRQKVIELLNGGLFNDPETGNISREGRAKIFEMLELGDWETFVESDDRQKQRAQRENNAMVTGEPATLLDFDDDIVHISVHNNFRLSAEYEDAIKRNSQIDQMFSEHVNQHLQSLQMKQSAEAQMSEAPYIQKSRVDPNIFGLN